MKVIRLISLASFIVLVLLISSTMSSNTSNSNNNTSKFLGNNNIESFKFLEEKEKDNLGEINNTSTSASPVEDPNNKKKIYLEM